MKEALLAILGIVLALYALAVCGWTIVLLKRWLGDRSRPPATIDNLVCGWPVYLPSVFVGLLRRAAKAPRQTLGISCAVAIVAVFLYPPWSMKRPSSNLSLPMTYAPIWSPPTDWPVRNYDSRWDKPLMFHFLAELPDWPEVEKELQKRNADAATFAFVRKAYWDDFSNTEEVKAAKASPATAVEVEARRARFFGEPVRPAEPNLTLMERAAAADPTGVLRLPDLVSPPANIANIHPHEKFIAAKEQMPPQTAIGKAAGFPPKTGAGTAETYMPQRVIASIKTDLLALELAGIIAVGAFLFLALREPRHPPDSKVGREETRSSAGRG